MKPFESPMLWSYDTLGILKSEFQYIAYHISCGGRFYKCVCDFISGQKNEEHPIVIQQLRTNM